MTTATYRNYSGTAAEHYQRYFVPAIAIPVSGELLHTACAAARRAGARRRLRHRGHRPARRRTGRPDRFGDRHRHRTRHDRGRQSHPGAAAHPSTGTWPMPPRCPCRTSPTTSGCARWG